MVVQTYQPASNETLGQFVDLLFQRLFFAHDAMPVVLSTYENDVAANATIEVNGKHLSAAAFLEVIKGFHATSLAKLTMIEDLVVVPLDPAARTGVVAQISKFTITNKADGKVSEHVSVTIVKVEEKEAKRVCQLIKLKPSAEAEYRAIHAAVWPSVLAALERAHVTDYSIHYWAPLQLLIANFKYTGSDYEADMRKVAEDPETQRWWKVTDVMQETLVDGAEGSGKEIPWWAEAEEVFRFEGKA